MLGDTISHYRITDKLGEGGMGVVYAAEDLKLKRNVALKFLPQGQGSREERIRFVREAQNAASLDHPNICTVHEIGEHDDTSFIVMALIKGQTLRERMNRNRLSPTESLDLAIEITKGLAHAHENDIVHRDIKPANVMVDASGRVTIMDFGLAKFMDATAITHTFATMGTAWYMSPEQVHGRDVDPRADLWSLGVVLFEMLSGRRPFDADTMPAVINLILNQESPALADVCEDVPADLDYVLSRCLAKNPGDRYQSASELLDDLVAIRRGLGEGAEPTLTVRIKPRQSRQRSRTRLALIATGAVLVAVIAYVTTRPGTESPNPEPEATNEIAWSDPPRVVVTSFDNQTGMSALDYVNDLTMDAISTGLGATDLVEVVPLPVEMNQETPLSTMISASDADIAVTGAFYLEGERLILQARVIDARTAALVFAVPEIPAMREAPKQGIDHVLQRVAGGLAIRLDNPLNLLVPRVPPTYEAFRAYEDAFDGLLDNLFGDGGGKNFELATELDSLFTRPRVMSTMAYLVNPGRTCIGCADKELQALEGQSLDDYETVFLQMLRALVDNELEAALTSNLRLEAIAPDDQLVQIFKIRNLMNTRHYSRALQTYEELDLSEDQRRRQFMAALTQFASGAAHALGQHDDELELVRTSIRYYPDFTFLRMWLLNPFAARGQVDSMKAVVEGGLRQKGSLGYMDVQVRTASHALRGHGYPEGAREFVNWYLDRRPERPESLSDLQFHNRATLLYVAERWDETQAEIDANILRDENTRKALRGYIGRLAARSGDRELADEMLEDWIAAPIFNRQPYELFIERARYAAVWGDKERAIELLVEAAAQGAPLGHDTTHDIEFESLLDLPAFQELVRPRS